MPGKNGDNHIAKVPNKRKGIEFPAKSGIIITAKANPSGSRAYRVDIPASLTGLSREQRQFQTKEDACEHAEKRHAEIVRFGHAVSALDSRQREDAARAIEILASFSLTLVEAARIAVAHSPKGREVITLSELRKRFLAAPGRRKAKVMKRRSLTIHNLSWRIARFEKEHGDLNASDVTTDQIRTWMASLGNLSPVSLNNYRRVLHAMFSFAVSEGYCSSNPVAKIPLFAVPDKTPAILTVDQAARLVEVAAETNEKLGLLGLISLGLFAGLRRAEIERLDWSAVKWERKMVTVDGSIAKSGSIRNVSLSENALEWLNLCTVKTGRVTPLNINPKMRRLRALAGIEKWEGNELRHSFASYHFDFHQNGPLTAAQLGHASGCQLLFEHYRSLVPLEEGRRYFGIHPKQPAVTLDSPAPSHLEVTAKAIYIRRPHAASSPGWVDVR